MNGIRTLTGKLLSLSPFIPYAPLGLYVVWFFMLCSGTSWVSETEVNGYFISILYSAVMLSAGLALVFLAAFKHKLTGRLFDSFGSFASSLVSFAGCALVILVGPKYLSSLLGTLPSFVLFLSGSILAGLGVAPGILKCAEVYASLTPRRVMLYVALSYLLAPVLYFILIGLPDWAPVAGGPSLSGIAFFCLLPVAASICMCMRDFASGVDIVHQEAGSEASEQADPVSNPMPSVVFTSSKRTMSSQPAVDSVQQGRTLEHSLYFRFAFAFFICAFAVFVVRASAVMPAEIHATFESTRAMMFARILVALAVLLFALGTASGLPKFGKGYSVIVIAISVGVVLLPIFPISTIVTSSVICSLVSVFEMVLWMALVYLVIQRRADSAHVFGYAYGAYLLACGMAWALGAFALTAVDGIRTTTFFYVVLASLVLLGALILFSERDFGRIFQPRSEGETTIVEMIQNEDLFAEASHSDGDSGQRRGYFRPAVDQLSEEFKLSKRETDVFRCLAMGYDANSTAERLGVSWNTVRTHMRNVYNKLDVHSKQELMDAVDDRINLLKKGSGE